VAGIVTWPRRCLERRDGGPHSDPFGLAKARRLSFRRMACRRSQQAGCFLTLVTTSKQRAVRHARNRGLRGLSLRRSTLDSRRRSARGRGGGASTSQGHPHTIFRALPPSRRTKVGSLPAPQHKPGAQVDNGYLMAVKPTAEPQHGLTSHCPLFRSVLPMSRPISRTRLGHVRGHRVRFVNPRSYPRKACAGSIRSRYSPASQVCTEGGLRHERRRKARRTGADQPRAGTR
jgi:hypothetical protein